MKKLNIEENQSLEKRLKHVISYTYIQKKLMRSRNVMSCETWTNIFYKHMLTSPP